MGAFKPKEGVQRGSVMDMPVYPGDPLTPGIGATKEAKRLDRADAKTIMKIPVLPISYEDALPLLQALKGPVAPSSWRGTLPITYHVGPSLEKVHMNLQFNWDIKPCYNVIAKWPGTVYPCLLYTSGDQCIALIGPNGCGKSTLIKSVLGLAIPDRGHISVNGINISTNSNYREDIGYMPQIGRYPDHMKVHQVFDLIGKIRKTNKQQDFELYESYGISAIANQYMYTCLLYTSRCV